VVEGSVLCKRRLTLTVRNPKPQTLNPKPSPIQCLKNYGASRGKRPFDHATWPILVAGEGPTLLKYPPTDFTHPLKRFSSAPVIIIHRSGGRQAPYKHALTTTPHHWIVQHRPCNAHSLTRHPPASSSRLPNQDSENTVLTPRLRKVSQRWLPPSPPPPPYAPNKCPRSVVGDCQIPPPSSSTRAVMLRFLSHMASCDVASDYSAGPASAAPLYAPKRPARRLGPPPLAPRAPPSLTPRHRRTRRARKS